MTRRESHFWSNSFMVSFPSPFFVPHYVIFLLQILLPIPEIFSISGPTFPSKAVKSAFLCTTQGYQVF